MYTSKKSWRRADAVFPMPNGIKPSSDVVLIKSVLEQKLFWYISVCRGSLRYENATHQGTFPAVPRAEPPWALLMTSKHVYSLQVFSRSTRHNTRDDVYASTIDVFFEKNSLWILLCKWYCRLPYTVLLCKWYRCYFHEKISLSTVPVPDVRRS